MPSNDRQTTGVSESMEPCTGSNQVHHIVLVDFCSKPTPDVLFLGRERGDVELPVIRLEDEYFFYSAERLVREIFARYGVQVAYLRCLSSVSSVQPSTCDNVVVAEVLSDSGLIGGALKRGRLPDLIDAASSNSPSRLALQKVQNWLTRDTVHRVPWSRPGWFGRTSHWVTERLRVLGFGRVSMVKQIRAWERSCVLSAETDAGRIFLKCVPEMFRQEPKLTHWLSQNETGCIPVVLDGGYLPTVGHYLLMRDYGGEQLTSIREIDTWKSAISDYASLQRRLTNSSDVLSKLGVPVRSVHDLASRAERLFSDRPAFRNCVGGLTEAEASELDKLVPVLRDAVSCALAVEFPPTLDHGDMWSGQIIVRESSPTALFTDWSDCALSHPFMGLAFFCDDAELMLGHESGAYEVLRDCYLDQWSGALPNEVLREQFDSAELLGPMQNALVYYERLLPSMEMAWEMEHMFVFHLRLLLRIAKRRAQAT